MMFKFPILLVTFLCLENIKATDISFSSTIPLDLMPKILIFTKDPSQKHIDLTLVCTSWKKIIDSSQIWVIRVPKKNNFIQEDFNIASFKTIFSPLTERFPTSNYKLQLSEDNFLQAYTIFKDATHLKALEVYFFFMESYRKTQEHLKDEHIQQLTNLTSLSLTCPGGGGYQRRQFVVTGSALTPLTKLTDLTLNLPYMRNHISESSFTHLTQLTRLDYYFYGGTITGNGLSKLPELKDLTIRSEQTGASLNIYLGNLTKLQKLKLSGRINLKENSLRNLTNLMSLHVATNPERNDFSYDEEIKELTNLKELTVSDRSLSNSTFEFLRNLNTTITLKGPNF